MTPPEGTSIALVDGAWRLEGGSVDEEVRWAKEACAHGLLAAEAWPLLGDLQALWGFVRQFDDPESLALDELVRSFFRRPGEVGELRTLTLAIDERHRRGLEALGERLTACPAPYLVDSDTGRTFGSPSAFGWDTGVAIPHGYVLLAAPLPGPPHSHYTRFDAAGVRLEGDGVELVAARLAQEAGETRSRLVDRDTGASIEIDGAISYRTGPIGKPVYVAPKHFHVEQRTFAEDFLAQARQDLTTLVLAALETGHPISFPDRFG